MKRKEIKFRRDYGQWVGQQDGVVYRIYENMTLEQTSAKYCCVSARDAKGMGRDISTAGHRDFTLADAKVFCQQIAAGEIDLEELQAQFDAEDMEKERAAIRKATEDAKYLRTQLEAAGISYMKLLELEVLRHALGDMGCNILLGWERGEGWPHG